jgi:hypothetical protein
MHVRFIQRTESEFDPATETWRDGHPYTECEGHASASRGSLVLTNVTFIGPGQSIGDPGIRCWEERPITPTLHQNLPEIGATSSRWEGAGLGVSRFVGHAGSGSLEVIMPFVYLLSFSAILPLARVVGFARRQRSKNTHMCAVCGYDLRATPDRCPECGNAADRVA